MNQPLLLAIDAGGTAVKVAVFDSAGHSLQARTATSANSYLPGGRVERDPEAFWQAAASAIRAVTADLDPARIAGIGCTGFGNGIFLTDERGRGTRPGIVSVDHRAQPLVDRLLADGRAETLSAINGHRPWGGQTLMQIAQLALEEPEVMRRTRWALACKDFIRLHLTGEALTDPSDASGGALLDLAAGDYAAEVFEALQATWVLEKLPPIVASSATAGTVSAEAAADLGLLEGTPLAGSMMDVAACALGAGVHDASRLVMIAGTWSINALEVTGPPLAGSLPALNMLHRDGACRLIAEGSPSSAANLGWYLDRALQGRIAPAEAGALVARTPVEGRRCHFLPYIHGPEPRRGAFLDLGATDDEGTMLRAIFESVAFQHQIHALEVLRIARKPWPAAIRLAGGAARSPAWAQIFADVCQRPVEVAQTGDAGALGAAICAAVAGGLYPDLATASATMAHLGETYLPNPDLAAFYADRYSEFLRLDRGLMDLVARPDA
ncbi:MAG: FGGY-family carbohydrate kinase [Rhodospirillales bacterium]